MSLIEGVANISFLSTAYREEKPAEKPKKVAAPKQVRLNKTLFTASRCQSGSGPLTGTDLLCYQVKLILFAERLGIRAEKVTQLWL